MKQVEKTFEKKTCKCGHGNVTISEGNTKLVSNGVLLHYDTNMATTWIFMCNKCGKGLKDVPFKTIKKLKTVILNTDKPKTLPRKMLVFDTDRASAAERTVFQILPEHVKYGRYLTVNSTSEEDFEAGETFGWMPWDNAEEIETFVDKAISEQMKATDKTIAEILKGEPTENKDYTGCKECVFEYHYAQEEPCSTCKDGSNFKQFKSSTGTLNGISGTWTFADNEARFKAIEKEIKKLKKKII